MELVANVVRELWAVLGLMAPYLLFGFLMAGVLSVLISPEFVETHLGGSGISPVAKASLFGVPLPLCSCSVIPVAASLRKHGASQGATTSFLLSTPQTGVDSILVTYGLLGPVFAVFRPLTAFLTGVMGGSLVSFASSDGAEAESDGEPCTDECCTAAPGRGPVLRALSYGFVTLPREIGKDLLIGLLIAAAISALVPREYFSEALGRGIVAMLVMMLFGIPIYVCASASVPIAAALMAKGVSPGAALVFLMTGPATNAAAITTIRRIMGWRTLLIYLATVAFAALGWGLVLDQIFTLDAIPAVPPIHEMAPGWFNTLSALLLLAVLCVGMWGHLFRLPRKETEEGGAVCLEIAGMTCEHCADRVRKALLSCAGVRSAEINLKAGRAVVVGEDVDLNTLRQAVSALGYDVTAEGDSPAPGPDKNGRSA